MQRQNVGACAHGTHITHSPLSVDFKEKFHAIQREYSPEPRPFYCFLTSAVVRHPLTYYTSDLDIYVQDTRATETILSKGENSFLVGGRN